MYRNGITAVPIVWFFVFAKPADNPMMQALQKKMPVVEMNHKGRRPRRSTHIEPVRAIIRLKICNPPLMPVTALGSVIPTVFRIGAK